MSKYSPQPWQNREMDDGTIADANGKIICLMFDPNTPSRRSFARAKANAPVLATAPELLLACEKALKYDAAIKSCANEPEKMASFCTAQGDSLDSLYAAWITASRDAIAEATAPSKS